MKLKTSIQFLLFGTILSLQLPAYATPDILKDHCFSLLQKEKEIDLVQSAKETLKVLLADLARGNDPHTNPLKATFAEANPTQKKAISLMMIEELLNPAISTEQISLILEAIYFSKKSIDISVTNIPYGKTNSIELVRTFEELTYRSSPTLAILLKNPNYLQRTQILIYFLKAVLRNSRTLSVDWTKNNSSQINIYILGLIDKSVRAVESPDLQATNREAYDQLNLVVVDLLEELYALEVKVGTSSRTQKQAVRYHLDNKKIELNAAILKR